MGKIAHLARTQLHLVNEKNIMCDLTYNKMPNYTLLYCFILLGLLLFFHVHGLWRSGMSISNKQHELVKPPW